MLSVSWLVKKHTSFFLLLFFTYCTVGFWLATGSKIQQDISYDIDDTTRIGRKGLGRMESFEPLVMKNDREEGLNLKASNNLVGGRELRLYCRFRGKCNIAEKYEVSGFAFAADYRDPQRHPPRHNSMKRKHWVHTILDNSRGLFGWFTFCILKIHFNY